MNESESKSPALTYVVLDKRSGRILHMHRSYRVVEERQGEREILTSTSSECDSEYIRKMVEGDPVLMSTVTDRDPRNLDVISTSIIPERDSPVSTGFFYDAKTKTLLPRPRIQIHTDKTALEGNGDESTVLNIRIVDDEGAVIVAFEGQIKVSTTRGKLSEHGGIVKIKKGVGEIRLFSPKETVDRVQVAARSVDRRCATGYLDLEFT
jgi:hypothetical protein